MEIHPPECLSKSLMIPNKTLMGPGPSNCSQRVLEALSNPVIGHLHPECLQIMDEIKEGIQYIFQTRNTATMCISASGHGGMEAALCNLIEDGDVVLIGITGIWGQRAAEMATRYGGKVQKLEAPIGQALAVDEVKLAFDRYRPKLFYIAQGDSSTGILQRNIAEMGLLCRQQNCLFIVDTVASLGGTEFFMDAWRVDVAYTGSQKVLCAPPGITPISFSNRAMDKIKCRPSKVKVYYWDVTLVGQYWNCFNTPRIYHHSISTTLLYGLREALAIVCALDINSVIRRHMDCSFRFQRGIEELGLEMFVSNVNNRLSTVNTVRIPAGVDWKNVAAYAMNKYFLEISGGLGPTTDRVFRIGLMGENATYQKVDLVLKILREAIQNTSIVVLNEKSKM